MNHTYRSMIHFFTWCNRTNYYKLKVLQQSAERVGVNLQVLGQGIPWKRNYQKIELLHQAIKDLPSEDLILATDAFDVLYLANEEHLQQSYDQLKTKTGRSIIFSAEKVFSHHFPDSKKYFEQAYRRTKSKFGYRYLNAGTFIGPQKEVKQMLERILASTKNYQGKSDQKLFGRYAKNHPDELVLDYFCDLFWCATGEKLKLDKYAQIEESQLTNLRTGTQPSFIHITRSKEYYPQLLKVARRMKILTPTEASAYLNRFKVGKK